MSQFLKLRDIEEVLEGTSTATDDIKTELEQANSTLDDINFDTTTIIDNGNTSNTNELNMLLNQATQITRATTSNTNETTMISDLATIRMDQGTTASTLAFTVGPNSSTSNTNETSIITNTQSLIDQPEIGFGFHARSGSHPKVTAVSINGFADEVDASETLLIPFADVDDAGSFFINTDGGDQVFFVQGTDITDTLLGDGAQQVRLDGFNFNGDTISETVDMNGVAAVATSNSFANINNAFVTRVGSNGFNTGNIWITGNMTAPFQYHMSIPAQQNMGFLSHYHVGANKELYLTSITAATDIISGSQTILLRIFLRDDSLGIVFQTSKVVLAANSVAKVVLEARAPIKALNTIWITVQRVGGNGNVHVNLMIQGFLKDTT